jgi:hypothetical protein
MLSTSEVMDTVSIEREASSVTLVRESGRGRVLLLGETNETTQSVVCRGTALAERADVAAADKRAPMAARMSPFS